MQKVVNTEDMDDDTFMLHFEKRHKDQLGGLPGFLPQIDVETLDCYRTFHDKIHELLEVFGMEHPHEHEE